MADISESGIILVDNQPEEYLCGNPDQLHTMAICIFDKWEDVNEWTNRIVGEPLSKWAQGRSRNIKNKRRLQFCKNVKRYYQDLPFVVTCHTASEAEIILLGDNLLKCAKKFLAKTSNSADEIVYEACIGNSCIEIPEKKARVLAWMAFQLKGSADFEAFLKSDGTHTSRWRGAIFGDCIQLDNYGSGEDEARGVSLSLLTIFLNAMDIESGYQYFDNKQTAKERTLLCDWFAGFANGYWQHSLEHNLASHFEQLLNEYKSDSGLIKIGLMTG